MSYYHHDTYHDEDKKKNGQSGGHQANVQTIHNVGKDSDISKDGRNDNDFNSAVKGRKHNVKTYEK